MKRSLYILGILFLSLQSGNSSAQTTSTPLKKDHYGFTLWLDCDIHHGAIAFYYELGKDKGNLDLKGKPFRFDPKVPETCQPQTWRSYNTTTVNPSEGTWDRGQLIPSNHMDGHRTALKETFYLSNTLPLNAIFNQEGGAWDTTMRISECYREITPLKIWGGVIWGKNRDNDFFTVTHGIKTPDFLWKLIYREDKKEYLAWLFPNHWSAKDSKMDQYLITLDKLKAAVNFMPEMPFLLESEPQAVPSKTTWPLEQSGETLHCEGRSTSKD